MSGLKSRAFTVVRLSLGLLLLTAAALKMYGWSVSTVPPVGWYSSPAVQAVAVGWEILLSVWLLWGIVAVGSWLAAIATFVVLAFISGYLGWIGQATCGCFGTIKASPWHAFTVDVAALGLLFVGRPNWRQIKTIPQGELWRIASFAAYGVLGVGVIFALSAGIGVWAYGSPAIALARLRGESLTVTLGYVDFGIGKPGEILEATVEVRNWTDRPIQLIGGTTDCSCVTTRGLPIVILPGEARSIPVRLKVPHSKPGVFTRMAELWADAASQRVIRFQVSCRVG